MVNQKLGLDFAPHSGHYRNNPDSCMRGYPDSNKNVKIDQAWNGLQWLLAAIVALGLASAQGWAAPIASNNAVAAVSGWLKTDPRPLGEPLAQAVQSVGTFRDTTGDVLFHVISLQPSGFVVVAGDDLIEPVVAFSKTGRFDPSTNNPLGALVARDLSQRKAHARGLKLAAPTGAMLKSQQKWQQLLQTAQPQVTANSSSTLSDVRVAPFVQSQWSQSYIWEFVWPDYTKVACYNYYTPPNAPGDTNNYPCGCVATALAQLMRYYQYPTTSVGTSSFNITVDGVTTSKSMRGGDGLGGPYVWTNMPLSPQNPTPAQCQAIGALTSDIGVSVQMNYASDGSGAYVTSGKTNLIRIFKYSNAIDGRNWPYTNIGVGIVTMLNPNLDARFPVILGISGPPGGHTVVCDGYGYSASTMYHHLNMGWAGQDDAWYSLPIIDTGDPQVGTFDTVDECLYNIYTNGTGEIISGRVLDNTGLPITNCTITATRTSKGGGTYTATTDSNGIYALAKIPSASSYSIKATKSGYTSATATYSTGTSVDFCPTNPKIIATSGNYWGANFSLSTSLNPPANDLCSGAILITGTNATNTQSTANATKTGDPTPPCATNFAGGVWFKYVPASDGQLALDTLGSSFDTVLALYTGSCDALTATDWNENTASGSALTDIVAQGTPYYILAGGENGETGNLVLHLTFNAPAPLAALASPTNAGNVTGAGTYIPSTVNQITALTNAGWYFSHWQDGTVANPKTVTQPVGGCTNTAYFYAVPQLLSPTWSNNIVNLNLATSTGSVTRIDVSTNLLNWTPVTTLTNTNGSLQFTAPTATNSALFYRAIGL